MQIPGNRDERDQLINLRAERNAGWALGIGLFWLVGRIVAGSMNDNIVRFESLQIAVWILIALTVSEGCKLGSQIWYYRADA